MRDGVAQATSVTVISCLLPDGKDIERAEYIYDTDPARTAADAMERLFDVGSSYPILGLDIISNSQKDDVIALALAKGLNREDIHMIKLGIDTPLSLNGVPYAKIILRMGNPTC